MRIDVEKVLFVGLAEKKEAFFSRAQQFGIIDFIDKQERYMREGSTPIQQLLRAIKILKTLPMLPQVEKLSSSAVEKQVEEVIATKERLEQLQEESRKTHLELARVDLFGDFSQEDLLYIEREGGVCIQFFFAKKGIFHGLPEQATLLHIRSEHRLDFFMGINKEPIAPEKMIEVQIEHPPQVLRQRLQVIQEEMESQEKKLKEYGQYEDAFRSHLIKKMDEENFERATGNASHQMDGSLFVAEGWIPMNKQEDVRLLAEQEGVYLEEIAVEPFDRIPTYLENEGWSRVGEDVMNIYDTPSIHDKDPSMWVLWSFAFFFAFIINDGGYGLGFLALALYLKYKYPDAKKTAKRFFRLVTLLAIFCIGWGVLTTSFFGLQVAPDNPLRRVSLLHWLAKEKVAYHIEAQDDVYQEWTQLYKENVTVTDPNIFISQAVVVQKDGSKTFELLNQMSSNILLELALLTGVIHLICSFARNLPHHWAGIGWIAFLIGGYLYFPYYLGVESLFNILFRVNPASTALVGVECLGIGAILAWLLSLIQNGWGGLMEPMNLVQVFADTLSYVRLYALGLAGGILSETINEMAGAMPFFIAGFVILAGHAINILLSIMGGVIHGLRLNFLEWYHYSFEGGGKAFRPLRLLAKEE